MEADWELDSDNEGKRWSLGPAFDDAGQLSDDDLLTDLGSTAAIRGGDLLTDLNGTAIRDGDLTTSNLESTAVSGGFTSGVAGRDGQSSDASNGAGINRTSQANGASNLNGSLDYNGNSESSDRPGNEEALRSAGGIDGEAVSLRAADEGRESQVNFARANGSRDAGEQSVRVAAQLEVCAEQSGAGDVGGRREDTADGTHVAAVAPELAPHREERSAESTGPSVSSLAPDLAPEETSAGGLANGSGGWVGKEPAEGVREANGATDADEGRRGQGKSGSEESSAVNRSGEIRVGLKDIKRSGMGSNGGSGSFVASVSDRGSGSGIGGGKPSDKGRAVIGKAQVGSGVGARIQTGEAGGAGGGGGAGGRVEGGSGRMSVRQQSPRPSAAFASPTRSGPGTRGIAPGGGGSGGGGTRGAQGVVGRSPSEERRRANTGSPGSRGKSDSPARRGSPGSLGSVKRPDWASGIGPLTSSYSPELAGRKAGGGGMGGLGSLSLDRHSIAVTGRWSDPGWLGIRGRAGALGGAQGGVQGGAQGRVQGGALGGVRGTVGQSAERAVVAGKGSGRVGSPSGRRDAAPGTAGGKAGGRFEGADRAGVSGAAGRAGGSPLRRNGAAGGKAEERAGGVGGGRVGSNSTSASQSASHSASASTSGSAPVSAHPSVSSSPVVAPTPAPCDPPLTAFEAPQKSSHSQFASASALGSAPASAYPSVSSSPVVAPTPAPCDPPLTAAGVPPGIYEGMQGVSPAVNSASSSSDPSPDVVNTTSTFTSAAAAAAAGGGESNAAVAGSDRMGDTVSAVDRVGSVELEVGRDEGREEEREERTEEGREVDESVVEEREEDEGMTLQEIRGDKQAGTRDQDQVAEGWEKEEEEEGGKTDSLKTAERARVSPRELRVMPGPDVRGTNDTVGGRDDTVGGRDDKVGGRDDTRIRSRKANMLHLHTFPLPHHPCNPPHPISPFQHIDLRSQRIRSLKAHTLHLHTHVPSSFSSPPPSPLIPIPQSPSSAANEMDRYELRWGRAYSRREEERERREPSRERGRSMERSPRHPAFRADRVPVVRDGRVADARTNDEGHAERADRDAWLQESGRGPGAEGGNHCGGRVFHSPEERGRRRDERGRWLAFGEQSRGQGGSGGSVTRGENSPHNAVREETPEQGVEDKEEGSERSDEKAGIEGANEARTGGTGDAETEPAEAQAETSPVAVAELEAPPPGSRGRDDPYEEGRRTESSGRQELGGPEMSHRAWQAPYSRGKGKEERSRSAERERRLGGGRVGEFRPRGERQEQGEWSGGASHSAGRQQPRGEKG
ncbi:unnamed protein product [Closterium sp. NIES-64]|nr:unnamed protein product [Closterium sp. NIES-64]